MVFSQSLNNHIILKRLAKVLIRLRVCAGWSEPLLVAHTKLLEISWHGSNDKQMLSSFHPVDTMYVKVRLLHYDSVRGYRLGSSNFNVFPSLYFGDRVESQKHLF